MASDAKEEPVSEFRKLVNLDQVNVVQLQHLGISMQAVEDKIIILVDKFKTGYECKECGGTGRVKSVVVEAAEKICDACRGKGSLLVIPEVAQSLPSTGYVVSMGPLTPFMAVRHFKKQLESPDISIKSKTEILQKIAEAVDTPIQLGSRIVFGPHVGTFLPMKGNVRLKIMRVHEPLCVIFGENLDDKDFIDYETQSY